MPSPASAVPCAASAGLRLHALRLLSARPHSVLEVRQRLSRVCARRATSKRAAVAALYAPLSCARVVEGVLDGLARDGFLDDAAYAAWHVAQREAHRHRARVVLRAELAGKGVAPATSAAAMAGYSEEEQCRALARKKRRALRASRDKLAASLARRGFPWALVGRVLDELEAEMAEEEGAEAVAPPPPLA